MVFFFSSAQQIPETLDLPIPQGTHVYSQLKYKLHDSLRDSISQVKAHGCILA